jgi:hypothetical protein
MVLKFHVLSKKCSHLSMSLLVCVVVHNVTLIFLLGS